MSAQNSELVSVLDQVIEFMEEALSSKQADEQRISGLASELKKARDDHERILLEKVAKAKSEAVDPKIVKEALARLQGMGIVTSENSIKLAARFTADPNAAFPMMVKLAEKLLSAPGDGSGIEKESADKSEGKDPDGWDDFAAGRKVQVKR